MKWNEVKRNVVQINHIQNKYFDDVCECVCAIKIAYVFSITYLLHINVGSRYKASFRLYFNIFLFRAFYHFLLVIVVAVVLVQILFGLLCRFDSILLYVRFIYILALFKHTSQNAVCVCVHAWCVCVCLYKLLSRRNSTVSLNLLSHLNELMSTIQTCIHVYARVVVVYKPQHSIFYFFSWSVVDTTVAFIHIADCTDWLRCADECMCAHRRSRTRTHTL